MIEFLLKMAGEIVGYMAVRGVDHLLSKWVAYFTIAFEKSASKRARDEYRASITKIAEEMGQKYPDWKAWKDSLKPKP